MVQLGERKVVNDSRTKKVPKSKQVWLQKAHMSKKIQGKS